MDKKSLIGIGIILLIIIGIGFLTYRQSGGDDRLDTFAQCVSDSGAKFYGAFWCSHCRDQKNMFGRSARLLPYVECSTADAKGQLPVCQKENIEVYPTWIFGNGEKIASVISLEDIATKTNCSLQ